MHKFTGWWTQGHQFDPPYELEYLSRVVNNTLTIHNYYKLNAQWSPVSSYMQFCPASCCMAPEWEISTRKIPVNGLFWMAVKLTISTEVQTSQVVCLGSRNTPSSVLPVTISYVDSFLFFFFFEMWCHLEGVCGSRWYRGERKLFINHSHLHRKCHMRVNCRIEELGVWCLNQGHISNPQWNLYDDKPQNILCLLNWCYKSLDVN